jgi:teichuronic acid biosynthesis glycosyltransferase TuaC
MATSSRIRIAAVTPYFPVSATSYKGNSAVHTLRWLQRRAEVEVICPVTAYPRWLTPDAYQDVPDLAYKHPEFRTTYFEYPAIPVLTRPVNGFVCAHYLMPYVRAARPDVILNYWLYPEGYSAVRVGRKLGIPVVAGAIGSDIRARTDRWSIHFVRQTMRQAAAVITVSQELRQSAIAMGIPPEKITAIQNGCDTSVFHPGDRDEARREAGFEPRGELILYAGNLLASKGLGELMEAFIEIAASRPGLVLAIVGQGEYGEVLKSRAAAAGVEDRVLMLGRRKADGVASWMRAADVFCLPSYSEGCPNVVVEALACGRPVVATRVGGTPELVDERSGILVPPRDAAQLRKALEEALGRRWDREQIAREHRRGWELVADKTFEVCRGVIDHA